MNECQAERLAIMEYDGNMTRSDAQRIYEQTMKEKMESVHYSDKVARLRELATLQRMGRHSRVSTKSKAGND